MLPLQKAGLDRSLPVNYRPISNLSTVSKMLKRLVLARLRPHLTNSKNLSSRPTGKDIRPRRCCSMSLTASTLRLTARKSHCLCLDLSAAFDTVCHSTLLKRLQTEFGVPGTALSWIQSYLRDRTQFVKLGQHRSSETTLEVGVLGSLLFAVYCSPVADVIASDAINTPMTLSST